MNSIKLQLHLSTCQPIIIWSTVLMGFHTMKAETQDSGKLLLSSEWNLASLQWFCCLNYCFKHLVLKSIRFGISIGTKMFGMKPNFRWETRGPSCVWNSDEWIHQLGCFPFRNSSNLLLAGRLLSSTSGQANSKKLSERQKCCAQRKDSLNWTVRKLQLRSPGHLFYSDCRRAGGFQILYCLCNHRRP